VHRPPTLAAPGTTPRRFVSRSVSGRPLVFLGVRAHVAMELTAITARVVVEGFASSKAMMGLTLTSLPARGITTMSAPRRASTAAWLCICVLFRRGEGGRGGCWCEHVWCGILIVWDGGGGGAGGGAFATFALKENATGDERGRHTQRKELEWKCNHPATHSPRSQRSRTRRRSRARRGTCAGRTRRTRRRGTCAPARARRACRPT
jgi:hypothetical protein